MKVASPLGTAAGLGIATTSSSPTFEVGPLSAVPSSSSSSSSSSQLQRHRRDGQIFRVRPYDSSSDRAAIESICKDVYGGRDYLPNTADSLADDPTCRFLVLEVSSDVDDDGDDCVVVNNEEIRGPTGSVVVAACANARTNFQRGMSWLEAVRTSKNYRGNGLAQQLTETLLQTTRFHDKCELYSCTITSNIAMRRVFDKVGMKYLHNIHQLKMDTLMKLPGWAATTRRKQRGDREEVVEVEQPEPLLKALSIEDLVSQEARNQAWEQVKSVEELKEVLRHVKSNGGIGYLPGLYELLSEQAVADSLREGLVWKLVDNVRYGDEEVTSQVSKSSSVSTSSAAQAAAVMALTKDEKIQSLRSPWVCSIAATEFRHFEGALWHSCFGSETTKAPRTFTVAVDGAVPVDDSSCPFCRAIPFVDDTCLLFGSATTSV